MRADRNICPFFIMSERNVINDTVKRQLGSFAGSEHQTFSGTDIKVIMYLPLLTTNSIIGKDKPKIKVFADLQTITISSTRSVSPVRVFGRSNPIAFTKGATTFAGTMVFATINKDAFSDIYDTDLAESYLNASTSIIAHQLPPFSVVITASNEMGAACIQVINGITITNYGTTYSVDDLYCETQFTYVATDMSPLIPASTPKDYSTIAPAVARYGKNITTLVEENLSKSYTSALDWYKINKSIVYRGPGRTASEIPLSQYKRIYGIE
jgi:hypothetical protein